MKPPRMSGAAFAVANGHGEGVEGGGTPRRGMSPGFVGIVTVALAAAMILMLAYVPRLSSRTGVINRNSPAAHWEGAFKTAGCDVSRCCCVANLNGKAASVSRVTLSGHLHGACDAGAQDLAITRPLLDDGTVFEHVVANATITYTLQSGGAIKWTNSRVPECDGFAYPSDPPKLLRAIYAGLARPWIGVYNPKAGANKRACCIPEHISIASSNDMFGIMISIAKEGNESRCFFRNMRTAVHQVRALAPQGNIISKMADGQPLRFILNGDSLLLDQPANDGCDGVTFVRQPGTESSRNVVDQTTLDKELDSIRP